MSLFFLLNPKQYQVGGLPIKPEYDPIKKRIHEVLEEPSEPVEEAPEESVAEVILVPEVVPTKPPPIKDVEIDYSAELRFHSLEMGRLSKILAVLQDFIAQEALKAEMERELLAREIAYRERQAALAKIIAEMEEEEEALVFLLLH